MMEAISYTNITVEGFPFQKILSVQINHQPNGHGTAVIEGEIEATQAQNLVERVDETCLIGIHTTAQEQPAKLFCGCVKDIALRQGNDYSVIVLSLYTTSRLLDSVKKKKTYQQISMTYGQVITDSISDQGDLHMMISDKPIGQIIMKYNETDWEFSIRMASQLDAPLVADIAAPRPQVYVGLPPSRKTIVIDSKEHSYGSSVDGHAQVKEVMIQDFSGEQAESYQYAFIGDMVSINGKSARIKGVHAVLTDGILRMCYDLMKAKGSVKGIAAPKTASKASGKMMKGIVQEVDRDKVKVHLTDIDKEYDKEGDWWFPFSTAYSSSDGSGWYCMPEKDDEVRVFFPSGAEGEAFAASSVFAHPPANPRNKSWKAPGGKEILLTDEGMYIIGKEGKIYINLTDEKGIELFSEKDICINSSAQIIIKSADKVDITAENQIVIGTEEACMEMTKNTVTLASKEIRIN